LGNVLQQRGQPYRQISPQAVVMDVEDICSVVGNYLGHLRSVGVAFDTDKPKSGTGHPVKFRQSLKNSLKPKQRPA
ncbi:MAG: hypothetical protein ACLFVT_06060, partial [Syntrophobacteria bacterium]